MWAWNGAFPVRHWKTIVPKDQRSAFASYWSDIITSGAIYIGDPHNVAAITPSCKNLAKPKSAGKLNFHFLITKK